MPALVRAIRSNKPLIAVLVIIASLIYVAPQRPGDAAQKAPRPIAAQTDAEAYLENPFAVGEDSGQVPPTMRAIVISDDHIDLRRGGQLIQRIAVAPGPVELNDVVTRIASPRWAREVSPGVFELRAALIQTGDTELRVTAPAVTELRLVNDPGVFMGATGGQASVQGAAITSWDLDDDQPVVARGEPRPFLLYQGTSRLETLNAEFAFLGTDPVGPGVSVLGTQAAAQIVNSVFHSNVVGLVFGQRSRGEVTNSLLRDNLSDGLVVEAGAGPAVTRSFAEGNRGVGIRLSSAGSSTVVADGEVRGNAQGGAAIVASSRGALRTTLFEDNGNVGIDIESAASMEIRANRVRGHTVGMRVGPGGGGAGVAIQNNIVEAAETGVEVAAGATNVALTGTRVAGPAETGLALNGEANAINSTITGVATAIVIGGKATIDQAEVTGAEVGIRLLPDARLTAQAVDMTVDGPAVDVARGSSATIGGDSSVTASEPAVGEGRVRFDGVAGVGNLTYGGDQGASASVILLIVGLGALALAGAILLVRALPRRVAPDSDEVDLEARLPALEAATPGDAVHTPPAIEAAPPPLAIPGQPDDDDPGEDEAPSPVADERAEAAHARYMSELRIPDRPELQALDEDSAWLVGNAFAATLGQPDMLIGTSNQGVPIELVAALTGGATVAGAQVSSIGAAGREATLHAAGIRRRAAALLTLRHDGAVSVSLYRPGLAPERVRNEAADVADRLASAEVTRLDGGRVGQQDDVPAEFLSYLGANFTLEPLLDRRVIVAVNHRDDTLDLLAERGFIEIVEREFVPDADTLGALAADLADAHADDDTDADAIIVKAGLHWAVATPTGQLIPTASLSALCSRALLTDHHGGVVIDITVSNTVIDEVLAAGQTVVRTNPSLAALREAFDDHEAVLAIGRPGMHFLPGSSAEDLGLVTGLIVAAAEPIADEITTLSAYFGSDDQLIDVDDVTWAIEQLERYGEQADAEIFRLDNPPAARIEGDGWWCSVRAHPDQRRVVLRSEALTAADRDRRMAELSKALADADAPQPSDA